jgi:D-amino-acid dehydrogenase
VKAIVIGAGVVGVNTAYQLAKLGVEVTVVDRADDVAQETSAVNAGLLASGHTFTWASPKALGTLMRSLRGAETAMRMHYRIDPELWAWGLKFLRNCPSDRAAINTLRRLKLSQYSRDVLEDVLTETGIDFDENRNGALFLYRDAAAFKACDLTRYSLRVAELRARTVTPGNLENAVIPLPTSRPDLGTVSDIPSGSAQGAGADATSSIAQSKALVPADAKPVRVVGPAFFPAN